MCIVATYCAASRRRVFLLAFALIVAALGLAPQQAARAQVVIEEEVKVEDEGAPQAASNLPKPSGASVTVTPATPLGTYRIWAGQVMTIHHGAGFVPLDGIMNVTVEHLGASSQEQSHALDSLVQFLGSTTSIQSTCSNFGHSHENKKYYAPIHPRYDWDEHPHVDEAPIETDTLKGKISVTADFELRAPVEFGAAAQDVPARFFRRGLLRNYLDRCDRADRTYFEYFVEFAPYISQIRLWPYDNGVFDWPPYTGEPSAWLYSRIPLEWQEEESIRAEPFTDTGKRIIMESGSTNLLEGRRDSFRVRLEGDAARYVRLVGPDGQSGAELAGLSAEEFLGAGYGDFEIVYDQERVPASEELVPVAFTIEREDDPEVSRTDTLWLGGYDLEVFADTEEVRALVDTTHVTVIAVDPFDWEETEIAPDVALTVYPWEENNEGDADGEVFRALEDGSYVPLGAGETVSYEDARAGRIAFVAAEPGSDWADIEVEGPEFEQLPPFFEGYRYNPYNYASLDVLPAPYFTVAAAPNPVVSGDTSAVSVLATAREDAGFDPNFSVDVSLDASGAEAGRLAWLDGTAEVAGGSALEGVPYGVLDPAYGTGAERVVFIADSAGSEPPPPAAILAPPQNNQQRAEGGSSLFAEAQVTAARSDDPSKEGAGELRVFLAGVFAQFLEDNPYALLDIPCSEIPKYASLAEHAAPQSVIDRLNGDEFELITPDGLTQQAFIQTLEDAVGPRVNMDFFGVRVLESDLPNGMTAGEYYEHWRTNFDSYTDDDVAQFLLYPLEGEAARWTSSDPLGTLFSIQLMALDVTWADDGSVVTTGYDEDDWIFSTAWTPEDWRHPISGNRQFGFERDGNGYVTYYTRAVDRITAWDYAAFNFASRWFGVEDGIVFGNADAVWEDLQQHLQAELGPTAQIVVEEPIRIDYEKLRAVMKGEAEPSTLQCDQN